MHAADVVRHETLIDIRVVNEPLRRRKQSFRLAPYHFPRGADSNQIAQHFAVRSRLELGFGTLGSVSGFFQSKSPIAGTKINTFLGITITIEFVSVHVQNRDVRKVCLRSEWLRNHHDLEIM